MDSIHVSDGELFGVLALELLEIQFDFAHILLDIPAGMKHLFAGNAFLFVIDADEHDGQSGTLGDIVEALLPVGICLAGSFGRDGQVELRTLLGQFDGLLHQRGTLAAVHRHATHPAEDGTQRPEEPIFLHHEARFAAHGTQEELADEQVPVGGMRSGTDDVLVEVRSSDHCLPAEHLVIQETAEGFLHSHGLKRW